MRITELHIYRAQGFFLVELVTDEGITGYGEGSPHRATYAYCRELAPAVIGMDPFAVEKNFETLLLGNNNYKGAGQVLAMCISAIEIAMWDIVGKALNVPVYDLLGGKYRDRVRLYASGLKRTRSPVDEAKFMARMVEQHGFSAVKLKVAERFGHDRDVYPGRTTNVIREVRAALGDDVGILVDANGGYTSHGAIRAGRMMEKYNVFHFEEPCPYWDLDANARVSHVLDLPVAGGEQDWNIHTFRDMLVRDVYDVIQFDVVKCGGLLRAKKISAMAGAFGRVCTPHCVSWTLGLIANLHFAVSTPELRYEQEYAVDPLFTKDLFSNYAVTVSNGELPVPDGPGLGVELDQRFIREKTERVL